MSPNRKNKNIFLTLRDREYNAKTSYFSSVKVISTLLRSDIPLYKTFWEKTSYRPIRYDSGYLYLNKFTTRCYTVNGKNGSPMELFEFQKCQAQREIISAISYSIPIYKNDNICECPQKICACFTQYLLSLSGDNWLCQYSMTTGKLLREIYVKRNDSDFIFNHCNWDIYGNRFVLNSTLNPDLLTDNSKNDVFVNIAVFSSSPFDFLMLTEIKRSVFGEKCSHVKVSDRFLFIGQSYSTVDMYSFDDFINQGILIPYQIGQIYTDLGTIGSYPTGLPLNFTYTEAPPLLFKVHGYGHLIRFGGFPYHYITSDSNSYDAFTVRCVKTNLPTEENRIKIQKGNVGTDSLVFHPDQSNRILLKCHGAVHCFGLSYKDDLSKLDKLFSMGLLRSTDDTAVSLFKDNKESNMATDYYVCSTDYSRDLDLFAVMSVKVGMPDSPALVQLYDNSTGEEIRNIELPGKFNDWNIYQLYLAMDSIIVIAKKYSAHYSVCVFSM